VSRNAGIPSAAASNATEVCRSTQGEPLLGSTPPGVPSTQGRNMALLIILLVLALIFGGIGLLVEAAAWALIIAVVLLVAGIIAGFFSRGRSTA
jgi:hypothetical protein